MTFKARQRVALEALEAAARKAGFELQGTELVLKGRLVRVQGPEEEVLGLKVPGTGQTFYLGPGDTGETRRNYSEVLKRMETGVTRMRVRGPAHAHPRSSPGLAISEFKVLGTGGG